MEQQIPPQVLSHRPLEPPPSRGILRHHHQGDLAVGDGDRVGTFQLLSNPAVEALEVLLPPDPGEVLVEDQDRILGRPVTRSNSGPKSLKRADWNVSLALSS